MKNLPHRYGAVAKFLHWTLFLVIVAQFVVAVAMLNTPRGATTAGFTQGQLYNWHKSVGLIALALVLARYVWRRTTPLPDWAPNLDDAEKRWIGRVEAVLYLCMFALPVSGYLYVMAGGYGVHFFGVWHLPNWIGKQPLLATAAQWAHGISAAVLVLALIAHWSIGVRHHLRHRDRYLHRMLPFTHQR